MHAFSALLLSLLFASAAAKIVGTPNLPQRDGATAAEEHVSHAADPLRRPVSAEDPAKRSRLSAWFEFAWNTDLGNVAVSIGTGMLALVSLNAAYNNGFVVSVVNKKQQ